MDLVRFNVALYGHDLIQQVGFLVLAHYIETLQFIGGNIVSLVFHSINDQIIISKTLFRFK